MSKNLVIVESPAKAKTINKYMGTDFTVMAPKASRRLQGLAFHPKSVDDNFLLGVYRHLF